MHDLWVYCNGGYCRWQDASLSPLERGFLYGDGLFETLRTYAGRPALLGLHVERLRGSARFLDIPLPAEIDKCGDIIRGLLARNSLEDAYVRITMSRGAGQWGLLPSGTFRPSVLVITRPLKPYPAELYERGATIKPLEWRRDVSDPLPRHKTTSYLGNLLARRQCGKPPLSDEAIILNSKGNVCECSTSNLFAVTAGHVVTPPLEDNLLPGVTRRIVLSLCSDEGIPARQESLSLEDIVRADEVFLTNALMEMLPVGRIIGHTDTPRAFPLPGGVTRKLQQLYAEAVRASRSPEAEAQ